MIAKITVEIEKDPSFLDTYANILFKLGKKDEAIKTEEVAIALAKEQNVDFKSFQKTLENFKAGN